MVVTAHIAHTTLHYVIHHLFLCLEYEFWKQIEGGLYNTIIYPTSFLTFSIIALIVHILKKKNLSQSENSDLYFCSIFDLAMYFLLLHF